MNQNICLIVGRVANTPVLKPYNRADGTEGYRCFWRVAVTRNMDRGKPQAEQRTNWIPCVVWGDQAKQHAQYLTKGMEVTCTGEFICETNRLENGDFGPDFVNLSVREVQYGQSSLKHETRVESLQKRHEALTARIAELLAAPTPQQDAPEAPAGEAQVDGEDPNPFAKEAAAAAAGASA